MKNTVKTEVVTIRLPSKLVTYIERQVEVTEVYANRPDFVITAMRRFIDDFEPLLYFKHYENRRALAKLDGGYDPVKDEKEQKALTDTKADASHYIEYLRKVYSTFDGAPTRIVIRIPIGFRKRWEDIREFNVPIESYLDFIRLSMITLVKDPEQEMRVVLSRMPPSRSA